MEEFWKNIPGFPDYKVSNLGRVLNKQDKILKPRLTKAGYPIVDLVRTVVDEEGESKRKAKTHLVHRLVAELFVDKVLDEDEDDIENLTHVIHKDGNKENNIAGNLKWVNKRMARAYAHSLSNNGVKDKLSDKDRVLNFFKYPKGTKLKNYWYKYRGKYYRVIDSGSSLIIFLRGQRAITHVVIARDIMGEPPSPEHVIGYLDFDYRNLSRKNLIWETQKEKIKRYEEFRPTYVKKRKKRGSLIQPKTIYMTESKKKNILKMRENGKSYEVISRLIGISPSSVRNYIKKWEKESENTDQ